MLQKMTRITQIAKDQRTGKYGFVQYFENNVVEKIICFGKDVKEGTYKYTNNAGIIMEEDKIKYFGTLTVHFHNKPKKEMNSIDLCPSHSGRLGMSVSEDGCKLFIGSEEKKRGLRAYDIETDSLLWRLGEGKIGNIYVYSTYLVCNTNRSIIKLDIDNGTVLNLIKSGTIEQIFDLGYPYVLADTISGKLCVINTESMKIIKNYGNSYRSNVINPSNCLSLIFLNAILHNNELTISGSEEYPNRNYQLSGSKKFNRIIDADFHAAVE